MAYLYIFLISVQLLVADSFAQIEVQDQPNQHGNMRRFSETPFAEADRFYKRRGENVSNAVKAIKIYYSKLGTPSRVNAQRYIQLARMEFYVGQFAEVNELIETQVDRLSYFNSSFENAAKVAKLFNADYRQFQKLDQNEAAIFARAIYVYSVSLSQWARIKGTLTILNKWPEIRDINQSLIDNAYGNIDYFGPYRVIGLAHNEMPPIAGGNPQIARNYLKKAFEGTLTDGGFSAHMFNNIAYATRFLKDKNREQGCDIVNKARFTFKSDYEKFASDRVPESIAEKKILMDLWLKNKCFQFEGTR